MLINASITKNASITTGQVLLGTCCKWYNNPEMIAPASAKAYTKM